MSSISGISSSLGNVTLVLGNSGEPRSFVEAALDVNEKMVEWYKAPMRIPETKNMFPMSSSVNILA